MIFISSIAKTLHESIDHSHPDGFSTEECPLCIENAKKIAAAIDLEAEYHDIGEKPPAEELIVQDPEICM